MFGIHIYYFFDKDNVNNWIIPIYYFLKNKTLQYVLEFMVNVSYSKQPSNWKIYQSVNIIGYGRRVIFNSYKRSLKMTCEHVI